MRIFDYDADVSFSLHKAQCHYVQTVPFMYSLNRRNTRHYFILSMRELIYLITASSFIMRRNAFEIVSIALVFRTEN
jgi:hypothetical protein